MYLIRSVSVALLLTGWSAAAMAGVPLPQLKPDFATQPAAVHLGLVEPAADDPLTHRLSTEMSGIAALSASDRNLYHRAFEAAERHRWREAKSLAAKANNPVPAKVIHWMWLVAPGTSASFDEIADFVTNNPHWPRTRTLTRQAEDRIKPSHDDTVLERWFASHPPSTGWGMVRYAEILMDLGKTEEGIGRLRDAWIRGNFTRSREYAVYKRHRKLLRREDHIARLDRLIWDRKRGPARRMLRRVPTDYRRLGEARLALMVRAGNVDAAIARVPAELRKDAGLAYERTRWRRRKGLDERAREYILHPPQDLVRPDRWWTERAILGRKALTAGHITDAYKIVSDHRLTEGADFAEAEWLAGWIALTFLSDADVALKHFTRLYENVRYPVSRARGAYWCGRAADALGRPKLARKWYKEAQVHPTTYYGQLATLRMNAGGVFELPDDPVPTDEDFYRFAKRDLVTVVRYLAEIGAKRETRRFILTLLAQLDHPGERTLTAAFSTVIGRPDLSVAVAKRSAQDGIPLPAYSYPEVPALLAAKGPEHSLIHAVSRQESEFDYKAVSPAGARGLMQLMPRTAKLMAKKLRVRYQRSLLTSDPQYNVRLGSHYLEYMVNKYDGSYFLALAAYNAGETRVRRWLRQWGDPRKGEIDAVDWIELIPYSETRNYVQRVMEGLQVYRHLLSEQSYALQLNHDLLRVAATPATAQSGCDNC